MAQSKLQKGFLKNVGTGKHIAFKFESTSLESDIPAVLTTDATKAIEWTVIPITEPKKAATTSTTTTPNIKLITLPDPAVTTVTTIAQPVTSIPSLIKELGAVSTTTTTTVKAPIQVSSTTASTSTLSPVATAISTASALNIPPTVVTTSSTAALISSTVPIAVAVLDTASSSAPAAITPMPAKISIATTAATQPVTLPPVMTSTSKPLALPTPDIIPVQPRPTLTFKMSEGQQTFKLVHKDDDGILWVLDHSDSDHVFLSNENTNSRGQKWVFEDIQQNVELAPVFKRVKESGGPLYLTGEKESNNLVLRAGDNPPDYKMMFWDFKPEVEKVKK